MCSIVGSFSKNKFKELIGINQHRGSFSYSFLVWNIDTMQIDTLIQSFGEFPLNIVDSAHSGDNIFYLGHTQAPTGGLVKDTNRIHPARVNKSFLFHNGIIKQKDITRLKDESLKTSENWDSLLMLMEIQSKGLNNTLNTIDGSFACIYNDNISVKLFRSAAGILFVDQDLNISSTKFNNSIRIDKDKVFNLNFKDKTLDTDSDFKSKSAPYFY